ncbi:helix-turn-helix domain-containing protein, partial [Priestia megaterium]|uniref:helix-turn-helix domain-containing protein n=1 Tax=Priestia megaterium TaxID=1404 RepID=UPI00300A7169
MYGKRIRELRKERKMTLRDLSDELSIPFTTLGNYEREDRRPSFETFESIADYFNVSIDYLVGRREQKNFDEYVFQEDFKHLQELMNVASPEVRSVTSAIFDRLYLLTKEELISQKIKELELIDQILQSILLMKNGFLKLSDTSYDDILIQYLNK